MRGNNNINQKLFSSNNLMLLKYKIIEAKYILQAIL